MSKEKLPIGRNIRRLRKKKGISQDRLSKIADVTYPTIIKLESGGNDNPTIKTLLKIAEALDVNINDLIQT